jgi:hypothetical protein
MGRRAKWKVPFKALRAIEDLDHRYDAGRRIHKFYKRLCKEATIDTVARDAIARRAAYLSVLISTMEVESITNSKVGVDSGALCQATNTFLGLLKSLGLHNIVKQEKQRLKPYLSKHYGAGKPVKQSKPRAPASARARMLHKGSLATKRIG